ncbi:right-handed parallel beta-helix repeat-containing protein [Kordiimonas sp.]|uniref:right-handed parallel beta-helix repeat-containing protein n=1 Tax=Kordiimonas sp. TaxID=1970157 RepID=UPI003A8FA5DC
MKQIHTLGAALVLTVGAAVPACAETYTVCENKSDGADCRYEGVAGIQAAVDAAEAGDTIFIAKGTYHPGETRDVPFTDDGEKLLVRAAVLIDRKNLTIVGAPGALFDGSKGSASNAFVITNSVVDFINISIKGFRVKEETDNVYDGHGLFFINSRGSVENTSIHGTEKMALTIRGASTLDVNGLKITDSHMGIWLEENARLTLKNSLISGSEEAGIGGYDITETVIENSVFVGNEDDGIYAPDTGRIRVSSSIIAGNRPYGLRALAGGHIAVDDSVLFGNLEDAFNTDDDAASVTVGGQVVTGIDPKLDAGYFPRASSPLLVGKGLVSAPGAIE